MQLVADTNVSEVCVLKLNGVYMGTSKHKYILYLAVTSKKVRTSLKSSTNTFVTRIRNSTIRHSCIRYKLC
jgi:hypothetical protein